MTTAARVVTVHRAWFGGAYQWGEGAPYTLGEPMRALPLDLFNEVVEALKFYGNSGHYISVDGGDMTHVAKVKVDRGAKARDILARLNNNKE